MGERLVVAPPFEGGHEKVLVSVKALVLFIVECLKLQEDVGADVGGARRALGAMQVRILQ